METLLVEIVVVMSILGYSTLTFYSLYSVLRNHVRRNKYRGRFHKERPAGRRLIVEIATNGQNPDVVEDIIRTLNGYKIKFEIFILKEAYDKFRYSANEITVPKSFKTKNRSWKKMRALQYGIEYLHRKGYGAETYIVHLDDDSIVNESYLKYVERMNAHAGQGCIRLRGYGQHLLSTLADMIRVTDCDLYCKHFNANGRPKLVHGEGLVVRADVEHKIGWDFGGYGADDLIMGISITHHGFTFTHIPDKIFISPPLSAKDFYLQRRRWIFSIMDNAKVIKERDISAYRFIFYRYSIGWLGFIGLALWLPNILLIGLSLPLVFGVLGVFNLLMSLFAYEYGVFNTDKKYRFIMLLMIIPVSLYESGTFIYTMLRPPKRRSFDVIKKARIETAEIAPSASPG